VSAPRHACPHNLLPSKRRPEPAIRDKITSGVSSGAYFGEPDDPLFGAGQGSEASRAIWLALVVILLNCLDRLSKEDNILASVGEAMGRTKRMECATANSTIDVDGDDMDEDDVCNGDPDLESVAHLRASSSLSVRTPY
jgi:hypothetical protein